MHRRGRGGTGDTPAEREAVRAAFRVLRKSGRASETAIAEVAFRPNTAGHESARAWWDGFLRDAFAALPGVEQVYDTVWEYAPDGSASNDWLWTPIDGTDS
jgi:hypothetical protein